MPLTVLAIKALKTKDRLYRVADSGGLCVEVSPAGSKLWRYRFNGKFQLLALGKLPEVGLEEARKLRDEAKAKLAVVAPQPGKESTKAKAVCSWRKYL